MTSVEHLKGFVNKRLTAAAEEIFSVFSKTIVEYEEVIHRQHKLLAILWKPEQKSHRTELPPQHACKEVVLSDQQLCIQERNASLDQEDPEPPQIKEEQEDLCISQEGEQFELKQETETFMLNPIDEEKLPQQHVCKEVLSDQQLCIQEKNSSLDQEDPEPPQRKLLDIVWKPQIKLHRIKLPQQHVCKEVLSDRQLCIQESNASLDQEDSVPPQIKEGQEDLCISQEGNQFELKQETETFMLSTVDEENDHSEDQTLDLNPDKSQSASETELPANIYITWMKDESDCENSEVSEPNSYYQPLFQNSHVSESQDQKESKSISNVEPELSTRHPKDTSHTNDIYKPTMSTIHVNTHAEIKSLKCDICEKPLKNNSDWQIHQRIHTGKKQYSCNTCGKIFTDKSTLNSHIQIHSGEKPFACRTCGKDFRYKSILVVHMRRAHTGEKPYSCNTCGKNYCTAFELKAHIRVHTGEKPYSCKICGRNFGRSSNLLEHMRIHTGEKPHSCNTCGKKFSWISTLKTHMRSHTGEKPFSCKTCGKDFRHKCQLLVHIRRAHTGEKPYACKICGKRSSATSNLARHEKTHRGK